MVLDIKKVLLAFLFLMLILTTIIWGIVKHGSPKDITQYTFQEVDKSMVLKDKELDQEIEQVLMENNHGFQNPLIIQDPFDVAPLTALAVFNTEDEVSIRMTIIGDREEDTYSHVFSKTTNHRIPVIGLYADRENRVILEQIVHSEVKDTKELSIKTEPLPDKLQHMVEITHNQKEAVDGITVTSGGPFNTPYAFDSSGNIRWFLEIETEGHGYFPLENGRFIIMTTNSMLNTDKRKYSTHLYDMDFLGRLHDIYLVPRGAHHEIIEKTSHGNLLVLSNSLEDHVEDLVVEIHRETGEIVKEFKLGDVIKDTYDEALDWAHLNSISYNKDEDSVILSVRNLSAAVKVNWSTQELKWILSDPRIWHGSGYEEYVLKPKNSTLWHYEQHTVYEQQEDLDNNPDTLDLILFDNRVIRNPLMNIEIEEDINRSSVTQYAIDESNGTVTQVKRFPNSLAYITSNFQLFHDEDRLIANHASLNSGDDYWGEIYEYEYSTGELVRSYKTRYSSYRAYRQGFDYESTSKPLD